MKRRDFLKISVPLSTAPLLLNAMPLKAFATTNMVTSLGGSDMNERSLVIIRLAGANDGINSLVPINQYDRYARIRPTLRLPQTGSGSYINLDSSLSNIDAVGLHPGLLSAKAMYDEGAATFIQGVGYPESNRSHFKSTDLWLTGGDGRQEYFNLNEGWVGRYLESRYPEFLDGPVPDQLDPLGIQIGGQTLSLGFHTEEEHAVALSLAGQDPGGFYTYINQIGGLPPTVFPATDYGRELQYLVQKQNDTGEFAQRISDVFNRGKNFISYPRLNLANQLKTVARLISGGSQTKIYLVTIGGFDTHAGQAGRHINLLSHLADSVKAFYDDLRAQKLDNKVVSVAFSEFGRKAIENANRGTDHGTLGPMFLFGPCVKSGVIGTNVNLSNLDRGGAPIGLQHDYRSVFGSLLVDWLGADEMTMRSTGFDIFTSGDQKLSLIDDENTGDPGVTNPFSGIGEVGKIFISQSVGNRWESVQLRNRYVNPVVVMGALKFHDKNPATFRVRNVTSNSFQFQVDEWNYQDGVHTGAMCHYIVVEAGIHKLPNNKYLQAGVQYLVDQNWRNVIFDQRFTGPPIAFTQCASAADSSALITRHRNVKSTGFEFRLNNEERNRKKITPEIVNWIAMDVSFFSAGKNFESSTIRATSEWQTIQFKQTYDENLVALTQLQTFNDSNPCNVRYDGLNPNSIDVFIHEEQSADEELNHRAETLGYAIFNKPGNILASSSELASPIGKWIWLLGNNGQYVSSNNGPKLTCDRTSSGNWERFKVIDAGKGKIALMGNNGKFVSSEHGIRQMSCTRTKIGNWEKFDWISLGGNKVALKGSNAQYVNSENGYLPMRCIKSKIGSWETFNWGITSPPVPIGQSIWLLGSNTRFVTSNNGVDSVTCDRETLGNWEKFSVIDAGDGKIALKGSNGRYLSAETGLKSMTCNRKTIGSQEQFDWIDLGNEQVALKGGNGKYVSSENGYRPIICNRSNVGVWETFNFGLTSTAVPTGQTVTLKGNNNKYVSSNNGKSAMTCDKDTAGNWEKFQVVNVGDNKVALLANNGLYVSSENGLKPMYSNRLDVANWEKFDWVDLGEGKIALRGPNYKYVTSQNGAYPINCTKDRAGTWETFNWEITKAAIPTGLYIWLKGPNQKYVTSNNGVGFMTCDREVRAGWEKLYVVKVSDTEVALRASNGKYVSSERGLKALTCNRTNIGSLETFEWIDLGANRVALKNSSKYVSSENGYQPMICNRDEVGGWEIFNWGVIHENLNANKSAQLTEKPQEENEAWNLYPSPATDLINLDFGNKEIKSLEIKDIQGKRYSVSSTQNFEGHLVIQLQNLKSGLYFLEIQTKEGELVEKKFLKQ